MAHPPRSSQNPPEDPQQNQPESIRQAWAVVPKADLLQLFVAGFAPAGVSL